MLRSDAASAIAAVEGFDYKIDENDPNYSEESDQFSWTEYRPDLRDFAHSTAEIKAVLSDAATEFIVSYEDEEFITRVLELNAPHVHYDVPKLLISRALDHQPEVIDRVFLLVRHMYREEVLSKVHILTSLNALFNRLDDLVLDVPNAPERLIHFVTRTVSNDLVSEEVGESLIQSAKIVSDVETIQRAKTAISKHLNEFFISHDLNEFADAIYDLNMPEFDHEVVKRAIYIAMDRSNIERELTSRMLADFAGDVLQLHEVQKGLFKLLYLVEELVLDIPNVVHLLAMFLARTVVDEVVPPIFLMQVNVHPDDLGYVVVEHAVSLLKMRHAGRRLENVWGPGERPVSELKQAMKVTVREFYESLDVDEFCRRLEEMNLPRFQHETVRRLFIIGLDKREQDLEECRKLLGILRERQLVSELQFVKGFTRIREDLSELELDAPLARVHFEALVSGCVEAGVLPIGFAAQ